jgi:hypothetical protein
MKMTNQQKNQRVSLLCCLLLGLSCPVAGDELGRFMTTPAEREMLNELREATDLVVNEPEKKPEPVVEKVVVPEAEPEEAIEIPGITVNGVVYRRGGKSTAWVNGKNTLEGDLESQYLDVDGRAIRGQVVPIEIKINQRTLKLKPGQTYQPESNRVIDSYSQPAAAPVKDEG